MANTPITATAPGGSGGLLAALASTIGPGLVSLIVLAPSTALPAMTVYFGSSADDALFAQLVLTTPAVALLVVAPFAGVLGERMGNRNVLVASLLLFAFSGSVVLFLTDQAALIASRLVLGAAGGGMLSSSLALIGTRFHLALREWILGIATALSAVLGLVALAGGGMLVDALGWRGPFLLYLLGFPAAAIVFFGIGGQQDRQVHKQAGRWGPIFRLWPLLALVLFFAIALFMPSIQGSFLFAGRGIDSAATAGSILAVGAAVSIVSAGAFGWFRRFLSLPAIMWISASTFGVGMLILALANDPVLLAVGCGLIRVGGGTTEPAAASAMMTRLEPALYGRASGLIVSGIFLGQFLNPLMLNPVRVQFGGGSLFLCLGLLFLAVGIMILLAFRRFSRTILGPHA